MSIQESIGNGLAVAGTEISLKRKADGVFAGRMKPYFSDSQNIIAARYGEYADNCYDGRMQGWDRSDFYAWWPVKLRCMDVSRETTGTNLSDDIKSMVIFYPEGVNYIPIGAHVEFASNTWIVTNPANMSSILSESIIRRCNAVYKRLDYYGNVLVCPFNNPKMQFRGAQDDYTKNMILADNYFTCVMQLNEVSAEIHENTRMILGDAAYSVRGLNNFTRAFTDDEESIHILYFQLQRVVAVGVYDDMERKIADGLAFSWTISLNAPASMNAGQVQTITPVSVRNGENIVSTFRNPFSYVWGTSDMSVIEVDENGNITAVGEGTATVTCRLEQNPAIIAEAEITVSEAAGGYVAFSGAIPVYIAEQESASFTAQYYVNGEAGSEPVEFVLTGPPRHCYSTTREGNTLTVYCWERSSVPLVITASYEDHTATHTARLEAW